MSEPADGGDSGAAVGADPAPAYRSKTDMVSALLREMILSGDLRGGHALRQRDIAVQLGVSQTPVREALRRLEAEGLVVGDPHRGATVAQSTAGGSEEIVHIRAALESLGARLAAGSITDSQLVRLADLNARMVAAGENGPGYAALNKEFHFSIYESADSPLLMSLMRLLWQSMPNGPQVLRSHADSTRQHETLLAALRARDGDLAASATWEHILGSPRAPSRGEDR